MVQDSGGGGHSWSQKGRGKEESREHKLCGTCKPPFPSTSLPYVLGKTPGKAPREASARAFREARYRSGVSAYAAESRRGLSANEKRHIHWRHLLGPGQRGSEPGPYTAQ